MKFQFCGGINCPQWFIAEISVLTKITAVKMKLLFTQIINNYLEGCKQEISSKILKLLNGTGLDHYEMCAVAATLKFILQNSVTFHLSDLTLNKQLIDLGLPKQNVESITKTYKTNYEKLSTKSNQSILKSTKKFNFKCQTRLKQLTPSTNFQGPPKQVNLGQKIGSQGLKKSQILSSNLVNPLFVEINLSYNKIGQKQTIQNFIGFQDDLQSLIWQLEGAMSCIDKFQKERRVKMEENSQAQQS